MGPQNDNETYYYAKFGPKKRFLEDRKITGEIIVNKAIDSVWNSWAEPNHIHNWNHASDDWHTVSGSQRWAFWL
ncbi:MAG: hypothetical protein ACKO7P_08500 [Bacteroidota bacterium]